MADEVVSNDNNTNEYAALSKEQEDALRTYRDGLEVATDYCTPFFQRAVRWMRLFDGHLPEELQGSFSRVMLNIPFQIVQNEIPRAMRGFNSSKFFQLRPERIELEPFATEAEKWLKYQIETVQNMSVSLIPTLQSAYALGNGYRIYSHKYQKKVRTERVPIESVMGIPTEFEDREVEDDYKSIITGQYAHFFSILPQPGGSVPNAVDQSSEECIDGLHWIGYMTKQSILDNVQNHGWDGKIAERMFRYGSGSKSEDPCNDYISQLADTTRSGMYGGDPTWISSIRKDNKMLSQRFRVGWFFLRDKWIVVGEDKYPLWHGKPIIDAIPVANHKPIPMMGNWFGRSMIGLSEDLIIAIMQNFSGRMDYLAQTLHPSTYIPKKLLDHHGGDKSVFDPKPYSVIDVPNGINVATDIMHDRYPDLPQQAFMEQSAMNQFMQKILGQPDSMSGQGSGSQADGSATGFMSLMSEGNVRTMQRAINVEATGIKDDLWLTLKYGAKYVDEDVYVRMQEDGDVPPWHEIAAEAITDGYGITLSGTKSLDLKEETYRKMISLAQFIINNPVVENQKGVISQMMEASDAFSDVDSLVGSVGEPVQDQAMAAQAVNQPGQGPIQNEIRSAANRNQVQANTGALLSADQMLV